MTRLRLIRRGGWLAVWLAAWSLSHTAPTNITATPRQAPSEEGAEQLFVERVEPILKAKCLACHGEDSRKLKGGLDLRTRESLLRGGDSGLPALQPGQPQESALHVAVTWEDKDLQMPPKENDRLSPQQIGWIRQWIEGGAPWPDAARRETLRQAIQRRWSEDEGVRVPTSGGLTTHWTERKYDPENLWPYQPLRKPRVPEVKGRPTSNPIDSFINEHLTELKLNPAPPADRRTLIRRATFDLTGLPPSPEEVRAFVEAPKPDNAAFAEVVDRLLASPHYGEQWGRHWLDVVRYADSSGLANDYERPHAWRYRDYVIRSFNQDKPYNQFVREQVAGDEINPDDPEMLVATGFLRMGPWELTGMEVAKVARQRFLDDVTEVLGQVFLSHPLQCARCHDHKFDPVPTRDYYRIQAVFATTQFASRPAEFLREENTNGFEQIKYLAARKTRYETILKELRKKEELAAREWYAERGLDYQPRSRLLKQGVPEEKVAPRHVGLDPRDLGMERIARKGLVRLRWEMDRYKPYAFSVYNGRTPALKAVHAPLRIPADPMKKGELEKISILAGGDPFYPVEPVTPGVLSAAEAYSDKTWRRGGIPESIQGRRSALANWLASADNPLTARSIMNRIWQGHFGRALAGTPNNFGATGKKPTHPEMLDWLASTFIEMGWSVKKMHRLIMMSEAYRRGSTHPARGQLTEKDPGGNSYAVFRPRRLSAEELRDSLLSVSGELNLELGGIPIRPEMNLEAALQPRQVMGTYAPAWQPSPSPKQRHRRSIYALKLRGLRDPFLEVFNQPGPDTSCEQRETSAITPQVFSLFNSQSSYSRALAMAVRLQGERHEPAAVLERAFALAFNRSPTPEETALCLNHWDEMTARHELLTFDRTAFDRTVVREAVEEQTGERFEFEEELEVYKDFVPDLQPADTDARTRGLAEVCLVLLNANEFLTVN